MSALRILAPLVVGLLVLGGWEWGVRHYEIAPYLLPGPLLIARTIWTDWATLAPSLWVTMRITFMALGLAAGLGLLLAILFAQSRVIEMSLFPYAVVLQVTPIVAIAPLIIIWADNLTVALLICAWIVAFFPILSNTTQGLRSVDPNLRDLFRLYGASRWQVLRRLQLPSALPFFLAGLRISGGLSLIGAIVAEFVAGTGGASSGLASRILEAGYQLQIPRMFAALVLVSVFGILIFGALTLLQHLLLRRWHQG
ncbi:ABC transporter permease [Roseococcus sp. YIM B11640]|uniref:ABC transporter permease n=1 Tax=Roseococcus sp. YIM B11640 TaxID=3133973 RepID=UPI003C7CF481